MGIDASGRVPRSLECELTEDLVDSCVPGDVVTINGIVKCTTNQNNRSMLFFFFSIYYSVKWP